MFLRLLLLFTVVPLVELYLLIRLGAVIGVVPTLALVIVTGALGASLARWQGLGVIGRISEDLGRRVGTRAIHELPVRCRLGQVSLA